MQPPGTSSGRPPGTAMMRGGGIVGAPPGTAFRRLGTAAGRGGGAGRQLGTPQVENRPVTNHGVSGMKGAAAAPGRQVLDKTYFLTELRQKRQEIVAATQQMRDDLASLDQSQAQFSRMDKRSIELMKEVRTLQEQLADHNMVLDRVGCQAPIHSITADYLELKDRNDGQQRRVDAILTERLNMEQKTKQIESQMARIQDSIDARLSSMPPSARLQYSELRSERQQLTADATNYEEAVTELDRMLTSAEGELARNGLKQKAYELQEQLRQLTEQRYQLQQEEEKSRQPPEQQREALMAKIKRENAEVEAASTQVRELQEQVKRLEGRVNSTAAPGAAAPAADDASRREKYEELVTKERELNAFLDSFPSKRAAKMGELQERSDAISATLERITKLEGLAASALPSQRKFREMKDELEYKKVQLENTAITQERLREELTARQDELAKIDTLEDKIQAELDSLAGRRAALQAGVTKYGPIEEARAAAEARQGALEVEKKQLSDKREIVKAQLSDRSWQLQAKQAQLQENAVAVSISRLEERLRAAQQQIYKMSEFVKEKESETNYRTLAFSIGNLVEDINGYVIKACAA